MTNKESKNPIPMAVESRKPWYQQGLHFKCTGCGKCCTGSPGYVWLNREDIRRFAEFFHLSEKEFLKKYARRVGKGISLKEDVENYNCIFLKENKCTAYEARPKQCRTFPWWGCNLESKKSWERASRSCEGINHEEAHLVSFEEIQKQIQLRSAYTEVEGAFKGVLSEEK